MLCIARGNSSIFLFLGNVYTGSDVSFSRGLKSQNLPFTRRLLGISIPHNDAFRAGLLSCAGGRVKSYHHQFPRKKESVQARASYLLLYWTRFDLIFRKATILLWVEIRAVGGPTSPEHCALWLATYLCVYAPATEMCGYFPSLSAADP